MFSEAGKRKESHPSPRPLEVKTPQVCVTVAAAHNSLNREKKKRIVSSETKSVQREKRNVFLYLGYYMYI